MRIFLSNYPLQMLLDFVKRTTVKRAVEWSRDGAAFAEVIPCLSSNFSLLKMFSQGFNFPALFHGGTNRRLPHVRCPAQRSNYRDASSSSNPVCPRYTAAGKALLERRQHLALQHEQLIARQSACLLTAVASIRCAAATAAALRSFSVVMKLVPPLPHNDPAERMAAAAM